MPLKFTRCEFLGTSSKSPVTSYELRVASYKLQVASHESRVTSHEPQATSYQAIDFSDAGALWGTATMWRLVGGEINSNVPLVRLPGHAPGLRLDASFNQPRETAAPWTTEMLELDDVLRLTAERSGDGAGQMELSLQVTS